MLTKTLDEICKMMGIPKSRAKQVLEMGIKMGALKKVGEEEYEMTGSGQSFASTLFSKDLYKLESGNWTCTKCQTINNALNGMNCIKCNYSFQENICSQMFEAEKKDLKYPKVTDKETLLYLLGQLTGMSMALPIPRNISFAERFEMNNKVSRIMSEVMHELKEKYPSVSGDEFSECLIQLNAIRIAPILEDAFMKIMKITKP